MEALIKNDFPQDADAFSQSDPIPLGSTPTHPSSKIYFIKGQIV
jgi:hypothetical protein